MRLISVAGYLWLNPRLKKDKDGKDYISFILTSDPADNETENVKFFVRVEDPKLIAFATHLKSKMKVVVSGEYRDDVSFFLGSLLYAQRIKAYDIRLVEYKKPVINTSNNDTQRRNVK